LALLLEADTLARSAREEAWSFAVELPALLEVNCTRSEIRWLAYEGLIQHATEKQLRRGHRPRCVERGSRLTLLRGSCFVLTEAGERFGRRALHETSSLDNEMGRKGLDSTHCLKPPYWDAERRELHCNGQLVKAFRQPAPNQEAILAAFEEEGWPPRIDNPLPDCGEHEGRDRLHDAIVRLNRQPGRRLLRFCADGRGEGVCWQFVQVAPPESTPERHESDT
jgi:hypothetical protein